MPAVPTGTSSIQIPVLCLLINGDPSTLEVRAGRKEAPGWSPEGYGSFSGPLQGGEEG